MTRIFTILGILFLCAAQSLGQGVANQTATTSDSLRGPQFRAFVQRLEAAQVWQQGAIIDSFMTAVPVFPFAEDDTVTYFLYRGQANTVNVPGDMNGWNPAAYPMARIAATDLWYYEAVFEPDARLDYKFVLNGQTWLLDPRNPRRVSGGFGPNSELAMPAYVPAPEIAFDPTIPHGTLRDTTFFSTNLTNARTIRVYLPPGYDAAANKPYPVALFHDGLEYITLAQANNVLDYLIAHERIQPVIGVFVPPKDRRNEYAFSKTARFEAFIVDELMPYIDARYRTRADPAARAVIGISWGGLIATQIAYNRPEVFGLCGAYSPGYVSQNRKVLNSVINGAVKPIKFYLDWGTYEPTIMWDARRMRDALQQKGYALVWNEWHEGHSWGNWRAHLDNSLEFFFPAQTTAIRRQAGAPANFQLLQNYPNPFSVTAPGSTGMTYFLPAETYVTLRVYSLTGRLVRTLVAERQSPGEKTVRWDGRDAAGNVLAAGIYIYSLEAGGNTQSRKIVLLP